VEVGDDQIAVRHLCGFENDNVLRYNRQHTWDDYGMLVGMKFSRKPKWAKVFPGVEKGAERDFARVWRDQDSTGNPGCLPGSFLDQDLAQVDRLTRLDSELLADLHALLRASGRKVADPVERTGDQGDHGKTAFGVGVRVVPIVLAVNVGEEVSVGRQLRLVLLGFRLAGPSAQP
jgi:hypothetical protein